MNRERIKDYARRMGESGMTLIQPFRRYWSAQMIDDEGNPVAYEGFAYTVHLILAVFTEIIVRMILSFVYVLALANVNATTNNFTLATFGKGAALGAVIMMFGRVSVYGRMENLWASWFPSSRRMFSVDSVIPYADFIHCCVLTIFQYGGSLCGVALALWTTNFSTINTGQPSTTADTFGLLGAHNVTVSQIWLLEMTGSIVITLAWLFGVVFQRGVKHHVYAGWVVVLPNLIITAVIIPATGANFDFIHYAALRTVLAGSQTINTHHTVAYLIAPLIGACIAWIAYCIISWLAFAIDYTKPGIHHYVPAYDPMLSATSHFEVDAISPGNVSNLKGVSIRHIHQQQPAVTSRNIHGNNVTYRSGRPTGRGTTARGRGRGGGRLS